MHNIAIFASGGGSNALKIIKHFENSAFACVNLVITNRKNAGVCQHAQNHSIPCAYFSPEVWRSEPGKILSKLNDYKIDFIALAGFLLLVPEAILTEFHNNILNIHPAILPDFGGKGMYGIHVHEAVRASGKNYSGITIHRVNARYDEGEIVFQKRVPISADDTVEEIRLKVLELEHLWYPQIIEKYLKNREE